MTCFALNLDAFLRFEITIIYLKIFMWWFPAVSWKTDVKNASRLRRLQIVILCWYFLFFHFSSLLLVDTHRFLYVSLLLISLSQVRLCKLFWALSNFYYFSLLRFSFCSFVCCSLLRCLMSLLLLSLICNFSFSQSWSCTDITPIYHHFYPLLLCSRVVDHFSLMYFWRVISSFLWLSSLLRITFLIYHFFSH